MVLTRRAARAAAEAAAAEASTTMSKTGVESELTNVEALGDSTGTSTAPASKSGPESEVEADFKDPIKPIQREQATSAEADDIDKEVRRSIGWRLWIGHFCALIAVATIAHAATLPTESALPYHALVLLVSILPLRIALAFYVHSLRAPTVRSGMVLALSAAIVFSSNALNVLATRTSPQHIIPLIGFAAVDVCAAWLNMTVTGKMPSTEPFAILVALVYSAADIFLAAVVAKQQAFVDLFFLFLVLRFLLNLRLLLLSSVIIVRRDERKKRAEIER